MPSEKQEKTVFFNRKRTGKERLSTAYSLSVSQFFLELGNLPFERYVLFAKTVYSLN